MKQGEKVVLGKILGLHIGSKNIQMVLKKSNKRTKFINIPTPKNSILEGDIKDVDIIASAIKQAIVNNKIKTKKVAVCINSSFINVREMKLPALKENELQMAAEYELQQTFPGINTTHVISFKTYQKDNKGVTGIVSSCPLRIIDKYEDLASSLGLELMYIDVSANCAAKVYNHFAREAKKLETVLLVDIGYSSSQVSIIMDGKLLLSRNVPSGSRDIVKLYANYKGISDEEAEQDIKSPTIKSEFTQEELYSFIRVGFVAVEEQIRQTIDFYNFNKYSQNISKIWVSGGGARFPSVDSYYFDMFKIPTSTFEPIRGGSAFSNELFSHIHATGSLIREA